MKRHFKFHVFVCRLNFVVMLSLDDGLSWPRKTATQEQGYLVAESAQRLLSGETSNLYEDLTAVFAFILFVVLSWLVISVHCLYTTSVKYFTNNYFKGFNNSRLSQVKVLLEKSLFKKKVNIYFSLKKYS